MALASFLRLCVCWSLCSHLFEDSLVAKSEQSKSSMVSVTRLIWFHLLLGLASQFSVYLPRPGHTTDNLSYQPNAENWHCKAQAAPANSEKLLSKFVHTSIRRDSFNSLFGIPSILKQCQTVMYPQKMICDIILQILLDSCWTSLPYSYTLQLLCPQQTNKKPSLISFALFWGLRYDVFLWVEPILYTLGHSCGDPLGRPIVDEGQGEYESSECTKN